MSDHTATIAAIKARYSAVELARDFGLELRAEGSCYKALCPMHEETEGSAAFYEGDRGWWCFSCDKGGDVIDLYERLYRVGFREAVAALVKRLGIEKSPRSSLPLDAKLLQMWPFSATDEVYVYLDGDGERKVFEARIKSPKGKRSTLCRVVDGELVHGLRACEYWQGSKDGSWRQVKEKKPPPASSPRKRFGETRPRLYRPEVWQAAKGDSSFVLLVEGPKDAESAIRLGFAATTPANGSAGMRAWHADELAGHRVAVLVDNDASGLRGGDKRARLLAGKAAEVRLVEPLGGEPGSGYDLSDWIVDERRRGRADAEIAAMLRERIAGTAPWATPAPEAKGGQGDPSEEARFTDVANAERFVGRHGRRFLYCAGIGWYAWTGACYEPDERCLSEYAARDVAEVILEEAKRERDRELGQKLVWWSSRTLMASRLTALLSVARSDPRISVAAADFDRDPLELNLPNGLLSLATLDLRPHRETSRPLVSKLAGAPFERDAACPRWRRFLEEVFVDEEGEPDAELIGWIQRAVGYSLTGSIEEEVLVLLHGEGANGKSKFLHVLRRLLGSYGHVLPFEALLERPGAGGSTNPDVANLRGVRLAVATESGVSARWNEATIKALTGGDAITAAMKYQNPITFDPTHKLWVATNHRPASYDGSVGFWRRVRCVPFRMRFRPAGELRGSRLEREADPRLSAALEAELPGILAWALEGARAWVEGGLGVSASVEAATAAYQDEQDPIGSFIEATCEVDEGAWIAWKDLREAYERWCEEEAEKPLGTRTFGRLLAERGIAAGKSGSTRLRKGVRLKGTGYQPPIWPDAAPAVDGAEVPF